MGVTSPHTNCNEVEVFSVPLTPDVNSGHETLSHAATCLT